MKIVFMGTPKAAVPALEKLLSDGHEVLAVYTQPDRPSGRGNKIVFSPVKELSIKKGLPVFQPKRIKTPETLETFRSHDADVAVVVAYGRILPDTYLNAFPNGAINVHFSLLPKYRGAAPVNWAIVNGETETGVTTMRMDAGLDTGAILMQRKTNIGVAETSVELMERLSLTGAELLSETLANLAKLTPIAQDESQATFAPILKREDGRINWQLKAREIVNRIRGFQAFPSAFTQYKGLRLTLWRAKEQNIENETHFLAGEVLESDGNLVIGCGNNSALSVEELQLEGKRRMLTKDFLNGVKLIKGEILGDRSSHGE